MIFLRTHTKPVVHRIVIAVFSLLLLANIVLAGSFAAAQPASAASDNPVVQINGTKNYS